MYKKIRIVSLILGLLFTVFLDASLYAAVKENLLTGVIKKPKIKKVTQSLGNASAKNNEGKTDLMIAVENGNKEDVIFLLSKGTKINGKDSKGKTVLMIAANGNKEMAELLLSKGADINIKDNEGKTALMIAAFYGRTEIVDLLLSKGADVNVKSNIRSKTALMFSAEGRIEIVDLLLSKGADINIKDNEGKTA